MIWGEFRYLIGVLGLEIDTSSGIRSSCLRWLRVFKVSLGIRLANQGEFRYSVVVLRWVHVFFLGSRSEFRYQVRLFSGCLDILLGYLRGVLLFVSGIEAEFGHSVWLFEASLGILFRNWSRAQVFSWVVNISSHVRFGYSRWVQIFDWGVEFGYSMQVPVICPGDVDEFRYSWRVYLGVWGEFGGSVWLFEVSLGTPVSVGVFDPEHHGSPCGGP